MPAISAMTGVGLTTSGTIYEQRLLTWSGWGFLALVLPCLLLDWRTQYAVFAVAMVFGYVLPGIAVWRQGKSAA